jgi:hypothetical protein
MKELRLNIEEALGLQVACARLERRLVVGLKNAE